MQKSTRERRNKIKRDQEKKIEKIKKALMEQEELAFEGLERIRKEKEAMKKEEIEKSSAVSCNLLQNIVNNGALLNELFHYVLDNKSINVEKFCAGTGKNDICEYLMKNKKKEDIGETSKLKTRCRQTAELVFYLLYGTNLDRADYIKLNSSIAIRSLDHVMQILDENKVVVISIPSCNLSGGSYKTFSGHILDIIKISDDLYYIFQSYIYEYQVRLITGNRDEVKKFISNYFKIFEPSEEEAKYKTITWTKERDDEWRAITQVSESEILDEQIDEMNIYIYFVKNHIPASELPTNEECNKHLKLLLKYSKEDLGHALKSFEMEQSRLMTRIENLEHDINKFMKLTPKQYSLDSNGHIL